MDKQLMKKTINVAAGRELADIVIKNGRIIDVFNGTVIEGKDLAIVNGIIAGIGEYNGKETIDAMGQFVAPGLIDGHIHIESSYVTPEELGKLVVPHGTTTIIADPHELVNVCGIEGINYMIQASKGTRLSIKFMLPSCVPATKYEHSGATIDAASMVDAIRETEILGLGEFMDYTGVISGDSEVIDKLLVALSNKKIIDGHSPNVKGNDLQAYAIGQIHTDHECATPAELQDRIACGMYVQLREGSACRDLRELLKGVTVQNSRRCILCSDDCQPKTIFELGHMDKHLRICAEEKIDSIIAIQMATINAAECYGLQDRGALTPGRRADLIFFDDLVNFHVSQTFIQGELVARDGTYLPEVTYHDITSVKGRFRVKDFSVEKLRMPLSSDRVHVIDILPGGVVTGKGSATIERDQEGNFLYNEKIDIVKIAVVERHQNTGLVSKALIRGYGIKTGAIAISIAHDSHNIIVVGTNDEDMAEAVTQLVKQEGGIVLVNHGIIVNCMPMVVGGIMSDQSGEWVAKRLSEIHEDAHNKLGISREVEPVMTLCFMSLPVIPELKITDMGLFDVTQFSFIPIEIEADK